MPSGIAWAQCRLNESCRTHWPQSCSNASGAILYGVPEEVEQQGIPRVLAGRSCRCRIRSCGVYNRLLVSNRAHYYISISGALCLRGYEEKEPSQCRAGIRLALAVVEHCSMQIRDSQTRKPNY